MLTLSWHVHIWIQKNIVSFAVGKSNVNPENRSKLGAKTLKNKKNHLKIAPKTLNFRKKIL